MRCALSAAKHWSHPVVVYADEPMHGALLTSDIPGWLATKGQLPRIREDAPTTGFDEWTRKPASYLWNAQKFAVKPFVWHDAATLLDEGVLVWLDADTVTTADVPPQLVSDLMGDADVLMLGRGAMHPETGFVAFRVPNALPLLTWCRDAYRFGWFAAIAEGWTDCHVLRAGLQAVPLLVRDLTSHLHDDWRSGVDAFALSPLGPYVEHLKGVQRKREAS
jgi:hypothetical protein